MNNTIELYSGYKQKIDQHLYSQIIRLEDIIDKINNLNNEGSIVDTFKGKSPNIKLLIIILFIIMIGFCLIKFFLY